MAQVNPIRYRGYYWDEETGFYYCQSRYYNPKWCRWISADALADTGAGIMGTNMYIYCNNDPVNFCDPSGLWGEAIHTKATLVWAERVGFSPEHAGIIAAAAGGVDESALGPLSPVGIYLHFSVMGSMNGFNRYFNRAVRKWNNAKNDDDREAALKDLGIALHALQDTYAHLDWNPGWSPVGTIWTDGWARGNSVKGTNNLKHLSWSEDKSSWSTSFFDDPDYFIWKGKGGLFYHENVGRQNNERYTDTRRMTLLALETFIKLTSYTF